MLRILATKGLANKRQRQMFQYKPDYLFAMLAIKAWIQNTRPQTAEECGSFGN